MSMVSFNVTYDRASDVLYLSALPTPQPAARSITDDLGIYWRYNETGNVIGATIIDYHDFWYSHMATLERALSEKFDIPIKQMRIVLEKAKANEK